MKIYTCTIKVNKKSLLRKLTINSQLQFTSIIGKNHGEIWMSVPIFLKYMDYYRMNNIIPDPVELQDWKKKYNN